MILGVAILLISGCGSDANGTGGGSGAGQGADCASGTLNGAGSSAQKTAVVAWIDAFQQRCPEAAINYDAQGSNNGRTQFIQKQVPWAGSDASLRDQQRAQAQRRCAPGKAIDLPMVITPIAIVYNLPEVPKLTLTPSLVAKIFNGKVARWDDPLIAAANPGVSLPNTSVTPIHRSADSGTSENLTRFLVAQSAADWPYPPSQAWPNSIGLGASISTTMVLQVKGTDGSIGYVDNPDAAKNKLPSAALDLGYGPVSISPASVSRAIEATVIHQDGLDLTLTLPYGLRKPGAYPALLATYEITCSSGLPADDARFIKSFFAFIASDAGQDLPGKAGYSPLPPALRSRVQAAVAQLSTG